MRLTRKTVLISSLTVLALLTAFFLALPPLARHLAILKIDEATGRKSEITRISFNPFTLTAAISGFRLSEKGGGSTFLSFSSARLTVSPLSLPKRAFIVTEIQIASPYLHVVRNAPNSFNFSDLLTGKKESKKEGGYLFSLNNIMVKDGSLDFQDQALASQRNHRVRGLTLAVPFFSNMPYLAERYVTPSFAAVVNGTPVALNGRLKPLSHAVEASIDLKVQALDLPFYLGYLPFPLPVKIPSGTLTTELTLGYRVDQKRGPEATLAGSLALDRLALWDPGGAPLVALHRAELKIRSAQLLTKQFDLASLAFETVELFAARDAAGRWNFQKLAGIEAQGSPKQAAPPAGSKTTPSGAPTTLKLAKLSLAGGKLHLSDATPKGGFTSDLDDIELSLKDFSTVSGSHAPFALKLATTRGEKLALTGELAPFPLEFTARLALTGIPLRDYYPYLADSLAQPITGTLGVNSEILFSQAQGLVLEKTNLKGENLAAPFGSGEGFRLKEALVQGIHLDLNGKKAQVASVELKGGNVILSREPDGAISALRLLKVTAPPAQGKPGTRSRGAQGRHGAAEPFSYRIAKVSGSEIGIRCTDRTKEQAPSFALSRIRFTLAGIEGPRQGAIPFTLAAGYGGKGSIQAGGSLTPAPLKLRGRLGLQKIPLRDFDAYLPPGTAVFIADGNLETNLTLNLEQAQSGLTGSFGGSLGVRSFYCQDTVYNQDLLKWESLQLDQMRGTLAPFSLGVKDVSLSDFYARVIVEPDGTLNLQHLTAAATPPPQKGQAISVQGTPGKPAAAPRKSAPAARPAAAAKTAPPAALPAPGGAVPAEPNPIRIASVTLQGGTLDFSDRHLKSPFDTTFFNLGGRVSGLSSDTNRAADVDLRGNLENHSPLSITGAINPLRGDLFLDLKIAFSDIELSPFTPYANTYLGYSIDKGKLNLDLAYKIDKKALTSQNKLFIDQFTFGKQVASAQATKLPVRLAVALLKDRKGEIHLDLPVVGQTDDPKFGVWKVILQILKNLLVKAATSPFALLGSMFGGGGEDFSAIPFAPGSERLTTQDQDKLLKLSQLLHDRPALNLEISGFADRDKDVAGYQNEVLVKKMKGEKFRALVKEGKNSAGETQEDVELSPQEYSIYLKAVYAKEKFPKPRNVVGIAKELPDAEMKKLILTHTVVGANELQALARERAETVRDFLLQKGKLPPERLFEKSADIYHPSTKEGISASRVEFGAIVK